MATETLTNPQETTNTQTQTENTKENTQYKLITAMNENVGSILQKQLCPEAIIIQIIKNFPGTWEVIMEDIDEKNITVTKELFQKFQQNYNACEKYIPNKKSFDYKVLFLLTQSPEEIENFCKEVKDYPIEETPPIDIILYRFAQNNFTTDNLKQVKEKKISLEFLMALFHKFDNNDLEFLKGLKKIHFDGYLQYIAFFDKAHGLTIEKCQQLRKKYPKNKQESYQSIKKELTDYAKNSN